MRTRLKVADDWRKERRERVRYHLERELLLKINVFQCAKRFTHAQRHWPCLYEPNYDLNTGL